MTSKPLIAAAVLFLAGGYLGYRQLARGTAPAGYASVNVNLGALALPATDCGDTVA